MVDDIKPRKVAFVILAALIAAFLAKAVICALGWLIICSIMGWTFEFAHVVCIIILSMMFGGIHINTEVEKERWS